VNRTVTRFRLFALLAQFACVSGAFGQSAAALHARAMSLYNAGDLTGAVRELRKAVALDASDAEAWNDLGVMERKNGDTAAAVQSFSKALERKPDFVNARFNLAIAQEALGHWRQAEEQAARLVEMNPQMARGHFVYGRVLMQKSSEKAQRELEKALELDPHLSAAHVLLGSLYLKLGYTDQAIRELNLALSENPKAPDAQFQMGLALYARADLEGAQKCFEETVRLDPAYSQARVNLAEMYENQGKDNEALAQYHLALEESPQDASTQVRLIRALTRRQDSSQALALAKSSLAVHPDSAPIHAELGKLLLASGDLAAARRELEAAVHLDPKPAEVHFELSRVFRALRMPAEESRELELALRSEPDNPRFHYALAERMKKEGENTAAQAEYARVQQLKDAEIKRDLALGHLRTGVKLAGTGEYRAAAAEFRQAVEANPKLGEGWFDLAGALVQADDLEASIPAFREALKLATRWPEAHYQYGKVLLRMNQREQAAAEFKIALEQDPQHSEAASALAALHP
jgi:protein O-GlcNAc transferase